MAGDSFSFNFHNTQTGDGAVNQQGHTIQGDATTNVTKHTQVTLSDAGKFFAAAIEQASVPLEGEVPGLPEEVAKAAVGFASQMPDYLPEQSADGSEADSDEPEITAADPAVLGELQEQAELPEEERDPSKIRRLLRTCRRGAAHYGPVICKASLAFGEGWLRAAMARNPIVAGTLAAISEVRGNGGYSYDDADSDPYNNSL